MNVAELERLLRKCESEHDPHAWYDLEQMAPSLARRVIAAEKLVEVGRAMANAAEYGHVSSDLVTGWDNADREYEATR